MSIKGILLDIDNTLYGYDGPHKMAQQACLDLLHGLLGIEINVLYEIYEQAKYQIQIQLAGTASSHNRLLYFQKMLELMGDTNIKLSLDLYHQYWKVFNKNMVLYDGVIDFFNSTRNLKKCFVTDLTADVQFSKLIQLNLLKFSNYIVTSEEAGVEKPHPHIFLLALKKLGLDCTDVIMVGDNYKKDILGAANVNIQPIWLNNSGSSIVHKNPLIIEFQNFRDILEYIDNARSC